MNTPLQIPGIDQEQIAQTDSLLRANLAADVKTFAGMTWQDRIDMILNDVWHYGVKLVLVIAVFIACRWIIKRLIKIIDTILERRQVDRSLRTFTESIISIILYIVVVYLLIAWLGINTSLFVAMFAAAGLAIGMAMSGVFQNFAGGVMILLLKPFHDGDWIEVQGQAGTVREITLFSTILRTADNKTIRIPNGIVSTSVVNNYNVAHTRRVEWVVTLAAGTDFDAVKKTLLKFMADNGKILSAETTPAAPAPEVVVSKIGGGPIEVTAHGWVASGDYLDVFYAMNERIYREFPPLGFNSPTQAMAVTINEAAPR